jgi:hypothetical protein
MIPCKKSSDLKPRHGYLLQRNIFTGLNKNLSLQNQIGWRPAEKKFTLFLQHVSSNTEISMAPTLGDATDVTSVTRLSTSDASQRRGQLEAKVNDEESIFSSC